MDFSIARCTGDGKARRATRREAATRRVCSANWASSRGRARAENPRGVASNAIALAPASRRHRRGTFPRGRVIHLESIAFDAVVTVDHEATRGTRLAGDLGAPHTSWYLEIPRMVTGPSIIVGALLLRGIDEPTRAIAPLHEASKIKSPCAIGAIGLITQWHAAC